MKNSELLNRREAAEYLGTTPGTLANWACTRKYIIPCIKIGKKACYRKSDLDRWIESRIKNPFPSEK